MKDKVEYYLVKFLLFISRLLPKKALIGFMKFVAKIIFVFEKRRHDLTIKNLSLAFGDKSKDEIEKLAFETYKSVAISIAEILMLINDKITPHDLVQNKDEALSKLKKYSDGKPIVFIGAHFGNWELGVQFLSFNGYKITSIGRKGNNELIENSITKPFREKFGNKNVHKRYAMVAIIKTLKKRGNVGLLIDQKAGGSSKVEVDFFGKVADTTKTVAMLKLKFDPHIVPIFVVRQKNGMYRVEVLDSIEYIAKEETNEEDKILKMTQRYNDILEDMIRKYPEQWFWMHNRWRLT